jgi:NMD protein affecting ribosome stability and mRNA decay
MKHCPICNKSSDEIEFFGEFCEDCAGKKFKGKLGREAKVIVCRDCGRIKVAGVFVPDTESNMERLLAIVFKPFKVRLIHSSNGIARIKVRDEKQDGLEVEHNVHLTFERILCDSDSRKRAGYYEAVLQFRGDLDKVDRFAAALQRYIEKNGAFVTRTEKKEHGVDVYVSDKKVALSFITVRHLKWKGSFELHGEKRGRRLYRNTYFITL